MTLFILVQTAQCSYDRSEGLIPILQEADYYIELKR